MSRKLTDGERIATHWCDNIIEEMVDEINDLIRRRQAEAWDAGYESHRDGVPRGYDANPYRGKR